MGANILVVDDELDMLALLAMIISEKTEHKVTTTNNPLEVVQFVKEREYDLIISDLKMPGMDGLELIVEIRKIDQYIPILVITAYGSNESAENAINKGAYDYITKPFRKEQILIAIDRALEWKNMRKEIRELKEKK
ncbi:MAG: response regulator [Desulfobacteraceae bacterium]|nr:response regulator [Desulfobacteraceae bacterium]MBC2718149.1 response regulator [Desulfobacteraceae bacterium]